MLDRYKWRHDSILNYLHTTITNNIQPNMEIYSDIPTKFRGATTIPIDIIVTTLRPDIVVVNTQSKKVILFELSVPFELNIDSTHERKVERYRQLITDIEDNGYSVKYYPCEIGSRSFISKDNISRLKSFLRDTTTNIKFNLVKSQLCKTVLTASYVIYHSKHEPTWLDPSYVNICK